MACSFRFQVLVFFCGQIQERRQAIGKKKQSSNFEAKTDSKMLGFSPTFRVPLLK
jgi:SUMO ligase MMS21 Smc5/6 complex component